MIATVEKGKNEAAKVLPEGWQTIKLGKLATIVRGSSPRPKGDSRYYGGNVPRLMVADVTRDGMYVTPKIDFLTEEGAKLSRPMKKDDVIMVVSGAPGLPGILAVDACIHDGFVGFKDLDNSKITNIFLFYFLKYINAITDAQAAGAIFRNLTTDQIKNFDVHIPSLAEQKRIAAILDEKMAAIEKARTATLFQIEAAKALPSAYLRQIFNSPEAQTWEWIEFEKVAVLQRGHDLPSQNQMSGQYPIVMSSGINGSHNQYTTDAFGVVTGRSGSIGKVYFIETKFWAHNTTLFVKDFQGNEPRYIYFLLQWMDLQKLCSGTGVPTLDRKIVHKVIVPKPPQKKQREISDFFIEKINYSEQIQKTLQKQLEAINAFPAAILKQAFNGEL